MNSSPESKADLRWFLVMVWVAVMSVGIHYHINLAKQRTESVCVEGDK